jgi:hypothetical protein
MDREELTYGRHRIIAGTLKGQSKAIVYLGKVSLKELDGESVEDAIAVAKAWIDEINRERSRGRRAAHIGTKADYIEAFQSIPVGKHHAAMLRAHANAPDSALTAEALAKAAGYTSFASANSHYGKLARSVAEHVGLSPKVREGQDHEVWTFALADGDGEVDTASWRWIMHPEVRDALRELNMV